MKQVTSEEAENTFHSNSNSFLACIFLGGFCVLKPQAWNLELGTLLKAKTHENHHVGRPTRRNCRLYMIQHVLYWSKRDRVQNQNCRFGSIGASLLSNLSMCMKWTNKEKENSCRKTFFLGSFFIKKKL